MRGHAFIISWVSVVYKKLSSKRSQFSWKSLKRLKTMSYLRQA